MNSRKSKRPTSAVTTERPPLVAESVGRGAKLAEGDAENNHEKAANGKAGSARTGVADHDRRRLKTLEIFLNNSLNLARAIESKQAAKLIQLLTEARERAIRLRG